MDFGNVYHFFPYNSNKLSIKNIEFVKKIAKNFNNREKNTCCYKAGAKNTKI